MRSVPAFNSALSVAASPSPSNPPIRSPAADVLRRIDWVSGSHTGSTAGFSFRPTAGAANVVSAPHQASVSIPRVRIILLLPLPALATQHARPAGTETVGEYR